MHLLPARVAEKPDSEMATPYRQPAISSASIPLLPRCPFLPLSLLCLSRPVRPLHVRPVSTCHLIAHALPNPSLVASSWTGSPGEWDLGYITATGKHELTVTRGGSGCGSVWLTYAGIVPESTCAVAS
jgi:hypothetical protein